MMNDELCVVHPRTGWSDLTACGGVFDAAILHPSGLCADCWRG